MPSLSVLNRTLRGDLSWQEESGWTPENVAGAAVEQGVELLIWEALGSVTGPAAEIRQRLDGRARTAATRDLFVQRELPRGLGALESAGVRVLLIKGSALAYTVYQRPWHRPRVDSDLLIPHAQLEPAERALRSCGYVRSDAISTGTVVSHQIVFERLDPHGVHHVVDLHWKIVNPQVVADALGFDELWERRKAAPKLGNVAAVPSAVDSVVLAAIHRLAHHQAHDRLIWLYDLHLLTSTFTPTEWGELVALAQNRFVASLCLDALQRAHDRLGTPVPAFAYQVLADAGPTEPSHRYLEGPVEKLDVLESDLRSLHSWRARCRLLWEHAFPPAAFIRQRYGVKNPLLLPALYLHRLLVGAVRWVR